MKLKPFQKKMARFAERISPRQRILVGIFLVPLAFLSCAIMMLSGLNVVLLIFSAIGFLFGKPDMLHDMYLFFGKNVLFVIGMLLIFPVSMKIFVISAGWGAVSIWKLSLPEEYTKHAKQLIDELPDTAKLLEPLIQSTLTSDDSEELE